MRAGEMFYRIDLKKPVHVRTESGSEEIQYIITKTLRTKRIYKSGDRFNELGDIFFDKKVIFEIRWFAQIDENFRIGFEGKDYRILDIERDRVQMSYKITCELINE